MNLVIQSMNDLCLEFLYIYFINVSGFLSAGVLFIRDPPDPFPNSEVKPYKADDTCCFGGRESRLCRQLKIQKRESIEDQLIKL